MKNLKELSNEELVKEYVGLSLEDNDKDSLHKVGKEIAERDLLLEMEVALGIAENRITQDEVDGLLKQDSKTLLEELGDGEMAYNDYYGNMFYMQKYENDENFKKAGDSLLIGNAIIRLILEKRGIEVD